MSEPVFLDEIDDEQAKTIDRNLALGSLFPRDVLHRPEIVDEIPTGSTLAYHEVSLPAFGLSSARLTAFCPHRSRRWGVRVRGIGEVGPSPFEHPEARWLYSILPLVEHATWASASEAFAAVVGALKNASETHPLAG
jgi:hypothetical protein